MTNKPENPILPRLLKANNSISEASRIVTDVENPTFKQVEEKVRHSLLTIAVAGEVKKGKSSFINALLKQPDLMPVAAAVATSCVSKIHYGEAVNHRVHFLPGGDGKIPDPKNISLEDVPAYSTENGNHDNQKGVDFIEVACPSEFLKDGIVLVDTPGIGGLVFSHKAITYRFLPDADAVLYVTDSSVPLDASDLKFLEDISKITENIYFLQSKSDAASNLEGRAEIARRNQEKLQQRLKIKSPHYFTLSARLKLKADESGNADFLAVCGYEPVQHFILNDIRLSKERILARPCIQNLFSVAADLQREIKNRAAITANQSEEDLKRLDEKLAEQEEYYRNWNQTALPKLQKDSEAEIAKLTASTFRKLKETFGPTGVIAEGMAVQINDCEDVDALRSNKENISRAVVDASCDALVQIQKSLDEDFKVIASRIQHEFQTTFQLQGSNEPILNGETTQYNPADIDEPPSRDFGNASAKVSRSLLWSGLAFTVSSFILPGLGPLIVGAAAGAWAWFFGDLEQNEQELGQIKRVLLNSVNKSLTKFQPRAEESVQNMLTDWKREIFDFIRHATNERIGALERERKEILKSRQSTLEEKKQAGQSFQRTEAILSVGIADLEVLRRDCSAAS